MPPAPSMSFENGLSGVSGSQAVSSLRAMDQTKGWTTKAKSRLVLVAKDRWFVFRIICFWCVLHSVPNSSFSLRLRWGLVMHWWFMDFVNFRMPYISDVGGVFHRGGLILSLGQLLAHVGYTLCDIIFFHDLLWTPTGLSWSTLTCHFRQQMCVPVRLAHGQYHICIF